MRLLRVLLCIYSLSLLVVGVTSAQAGWTTWLYEPATGEILHLNAGGKVLETHSLTIPDGYILPDALAVNPQGSIAAYTLLNPVTYEQRLVVIDISAEQELFRFDLPDPALGVRNREDTLFIMPDSRAFDPTGEIVTFSYRIAGEEWAIGVIDLMTDTRLYLTSNDPALDPYPDIHAGLLPVVQHFAGNTITFTTPNDRSRPFPEQHNYSWNIATNSVSAAVAYPRFETAALITGETVTPLHDTRLPGENDSVKLPERHFNALHVFDPDEAARFPFYGHPEYNVRRAVFIQGGGRVLAHVENDGGITSWLVIGRDGAIIRQLADAGYDMTGTPDGFIYLTKLADSRSVLVHVDTRTMSRGETVWVGKGNWRIAWAELAPTADTAADDTWAHLAEPVYPPESTPVSGAAPTPLPTPYPALRPGMAAQVYTLEDDLLNLRSAPTLDSQVISFLESGTRLILLEGPVNTDGFTWWRVQVGTREGWIVESLPGVQTIIPPQDIRKPDEDRTPQPDSNDE